MCKIVILHSVSKRNLSAPREIVDFPKTCGIIIHKFSPESPTNPRQIQHLYYNICYRNFILVASTLLGNREIGV